MTLVEAMKTHKKVSRPHWDSYFIYYQPKTGPYKDLVDCDYFVFYEPNAEPLFSTSIDLYPEDLWANDYLVLE